MKLGIIGSRTLTVENLEDYIPEGVTEIISGGAKGIDTCAQKYADEHGLKMTVFLPKYEKFGRAAPVYRNADIVAHSDKVIAFWDGVSKGTFGALKLCRQKNIPCDIYLHGANGYSDLPSCAEEKYFKKPTKSQKALGESLYDLLTQNDANN